MYLFFLKPFPCLNGYQSAFYSISELKREFSGIHRKIITLNIQTMTWIRRPPTEADIGLEYAKVLNHWLSSNLSK